MLKPLAHFLFTLTGWKVVGKLPADVKKCVMIAGPHTSNWDLFYARTAFYIMGIPLRYTIKAEMMRYFPLNIILKWLGAIPVERDKTKAHRRGQGSMVHAMAKLFNERDELVVMVTPEATRKFVKKWKTGFYQVALRAQVPIVCGYLDYSKKHAGIGPVIFPSGDLQADMVKILEFYDQIKGKYPEKGVDISRMDMTYKSPSVVKAG
ncbi:1-acyl-sn-glycerol-3-phosphate acyltransferase [Nafulsella turpanensis]|uniref:1-acyl-sn-glycerol-3-phosphate acyltransferase n=1 Tax=Nafulsella turpanensis TaxID=1265690 RepID=UPI00034C48AD|nr:1-acyl-sn-glycerol-3-phosphate acyltransferase [Nafulsella turpanensis]